MDDDDDDDVRWVKSKSGLKKLYIQNMFKTLWIILQLIMVIIMIMMMTIREKQ